MTEAREGDFESYIKRFARPAGGYELPDGAGVEEASAMP